MIELNGKYILVAGELALLDNLAISLNAHGANVKRIDTSAMDAAIVERPAEAVVISAGWQQERPFIKTTPRDWQEALNRNVEQIVFAAQTTARRMIANRIAGRIVILSSTAALKPLRDRSAMGTSLAALHAIARIAAVDLGAHGITINVIAAGWNDAGWVLSALDSDVSATIPVGRLTETRDLSEVCALLLSDAGAYITGAIIPVDGGYAITKAGTATPPRPSESFQDKI